MIRRGLAKAAASGAAAVLLGAGLGSAGVASASSRWAVQRVVKPSKGASALPGVSCVTGGTCMAVGSYRVKNAQGKPVGVPLADLKASGSGWTQQAVPVPAGTISAGLSSVSCPSASFCMAVGLDYGGQGIVPLADSWDGAKWSVLAVPNPAPAYGAGFSGVSCSSATFCMAVGSAYSTPNTDVVETWDGTSWSVQAAGTGSGGGLVAVSCPSATYCAAIGIEASGNWLAENWDGSTWTTHPVPKPAGVTGISLFGVSCASAAACTAVGWTVTQPSATQGGLAVRWNGTRWSLQPVPAGSTALYGVSCPTAGSCTAVGAFPPPHPAPAAESWSPAGGWTLQAPAAPAKAIYSVLEGVSCLSATTCTATGYYNIVNPGAAGIPLAEHE